MSEKIKKPFYKKWWFWVIIAVIIIVIFFPDAEDDNVTESEPSTEHNSNETDVSVVEDTDDQTDVSESYLSFGSTFEWQDLQITFGDDVQWATIDNMLSDYDGEYYFAIPILIENITDSTQTWSPSDMTFFGSNGTESSSIWLWIDYNASPLGTDIRSGGVLNTYVHFLYDGDGNYFIEFSRLLSNDTAEAMFPISR